MTDFEKFIMKKTVIINLRLKGDWTERHTVIRRNESVPMDAIVVSTYDLVTDTTVVSIQYTE